jgi:hypothetical protein
LRTIDLREAELAGNPFGVTPELKGGIFGEPALPRYGLRMLQS